MNCIITIAGNGSGRYGSPKTPRTGPISEFRVDNTVFYIAITNHLKTCNVCNIEEILRVYLERRKKSPKFNGFTSSGLAKRAQILEKLAIKKKKPVPKELVNEFLWRAGPYFTQYFGDRLSPREKILGFKVLFSVPEFTQVGLLTNVDMTLAKIAQDSSGKDFTDEEIESLVRVAEVIYA